MPYKKELAAIIKTNNCPAKLSGRAVSPENGNDISPSTGRDEKLMVMREAENQ